MAQQGSDNSVVPCTSHLPVDFISILSAIVAVFLFLLHSSYIRFFIIFYHFLPFFIYLFIVHPAKVCRQLDGLSHFHFTPKPVVSESRIFGSGPEAALPSLSLEDIIPTTESSSTVLAPEEVRYSLVNSHLFQFLCYFRILSLHHFIVHGFHHLHANLR